MQVGQNRITIDMLRYVRHAAQQEGESGVWRQNLLPIEH